MVATAEPSREETAPTAEPEPDPEPSPDPEPEANQTAELERLITDTQIYFSSGSTRVRETEREKLTALTQQLSNTPEQNVDIRGLADPVGNADANRRLAQRRCTAVMIALEESGIDPSRLRIIGGGEKAPQPSEASWKLRRVEFTLTQAESAAMLADAGSGISSDPIADTHIYFEKSRTQLTPPKRSKLDEVANLLKQDSPGILGISGFTDPKGNRSYNQRLSKLRCEVVFDYLIKQGVPDTRLKTQTGGELTDANTGEPSWKKRRVQFQWIELAASG